MPIRITLWPAHPYASAGGIGMPSYGYWDRLLLVRDIWPALMLYWGGNDTLNRRNALTNTFVVEANRR